MSDPYRTLALDVLSKLNALEFLISMSPGNYKNKRFKDGFEKDNQWHHLAGLTAASIGCAQFLESRDPDQPIITEDPVLVASLLHEFCKVMYILSHYEEYEETEKNAFAIHHSLRSIIILLVGYRRR